MKSQEQTETQHFLTIQNRELTKKTKKQKPPNLLNTKIKYRIQNAKSKINQNPSYASNIQTTYLI